MFDIKYSDLKEKARKSLELPLIVGDQIISAKLAISFEEQAKGLSGVEKLFRNQGMLFCYKKPEIVNFWMKGIKLSKLGILFLDIKGKVVAKEIMTSENPAFLYSSKVPIDYVLELNSEIVEKVKIGDMVEKF